MGDRLPNPATVRVLKVRFVQPSGKSLKEVLREARSGVSYSYFVGLDDKVVLSRVKLKSNSDSSLTWVAYDSSDAASNGLIVKEAGAFVFNPNSKERGYSLTPSYKPFDLAEEELVKMRNAFGEDASLIRHADEGVAKAKMLDCSQIYALQRAGSGFISDSVIANNVVTAGVLMVRSPEIIFDPDKRDLLLSEIININVFTAIKATGSKFITLSSGGYLRRLASRVGVGVVATEAQSHVAAALLSDHKNSKGEEVASSDRADRIRDFQRYYWMIPSLIKSDLLDQAVLKKLPHLSYQMCLDGAALKVFVSAKMVRMVEGVFSTALYFGLRKVVTGE